MDHRTIGENGGKAIMMKTNFRARQPYANIFLKCAKEFECNSPVRPENFMKKMMTNKGTVSGLSGNGLDKDGLELKNPVVVALGDSVTAGHFESLLPKEPALANRLMQKAVMAAASGDWSDPELNAALWHSKARENEIGFPPIEITDARECYLEKFRLKLIDQYEFTSVSTINAGIAGDNLKMMVKRADRDVVRYQPDLVLINGALNWDESLGTTAEYKELLRGLVRKLKKETEADIILLTPNGDLPNTLMGPTDIMPTTSERAAAIRELAVEEQVCLSDTYGVWERARDMGCPWEELLANGVNHPGIEGHEVYAITLMKLFE